MLQRDGLVDMESYRGASVASVGWERVFEAVTVRMHLEVLAAREAAPHHTPETIVSLEELLGRLDRARELGRAASFSDLNREFHTRAYEPGTIGLLKEEVQALWDTMWRTRARSLFRMDPARMEGAQREHRALLEALRRGDPEAAAEAAQRHMIETLSAWRLVMETELRTAH